jgi:hypothetical protein
VNSGDFRRAQEEICMLTRREALRQASVLGAGALDAGYDAFVNGTWAPSYLLGTRKAYVEV